MENQELKLFNLLMKIAKETKDKRLLKELKYYKRIKEVVIKNV